MTQALIGELFFVGNYGQRYIGLRRGHKGRRINARILHAGQLKLPPGDHWASATNSFNHYTLVPGATGEAAA